MKKNIEQIRKDLAKIDDKAELIMSAVELAMIRKKNKKIIEKIKNGKKG